MANRKDLKGNWYVQRAELKKKFPDYPFLHDVLEMIDETSEESVYAHSSKVKLSK